MRKQWRKVQKIFTKETVVKTMLRGGKIILACCAAGVISEVTPATIKFDIAPNDRERRSQPTICNSGYAETIDVISDSIMSSHYKNEAIELVPFDASSELYQAIIYVMRSDMTDYHKKEAIANMCR